MLKAMPDLAIEAKKNVRCLSMEMAKELISLSDRPLLIDVRENQEHSASNLPDFINIPRGVLEMKIGEYCQNPDQCIILHCGTGGRAALAAESLERMGYRNVHLINASYEDLHRVFGR